jgi:hypothetical protein
VHAGFSDPGGPSRVGQSGGPPYSLADSVLPSAPLESVGLHDKLDLGAHSPQLAFSAVYAS